MNADDRAEVLYNLVKPYKKLFLSTDAYLPTTELIDFVAEHGDCPSVVIRNMRHRGKEADKGNFYPLRQISLFGHSLRVARLAVTLTRAFYRLNVLVPAAIVAGIGHDIGKAPGLIGPSYYVTADHPLTAVHHLRAIFAGHNVPWYGAAEQAILRHHMAPDSDFDSVIKRADALARQEEVKLVSSGSVSYRPMKEWFDVWEFLQLLGRKINVIETDNNGYCGAFAHGHIVYCQPDALIDTARILATGSSVVDMEFFFPEERRKILVGIVDRLREAKALALQVGEGYFSRKFRVTYRNGRSVESFYIPIALSAFDAAPLEYYKRRDGYLCEISEVKAVT